MISWYFLLKTKPNQNTLTHFQQGKVHIGNCKEMKITFARTLSQISPSKSDSDAISQA